MRNYQIVTIIITLLSVNISVSCAQKAPEPGVVPGAARKWTYLSYVGDKPFGGRWPTTPPWLATRTW
ncbi:MAG: hypothetical protein U5L09_10790 [Bacteroidales bacterium]|nr:hypothetical protein [Bacteroidales bacterium]